MTDEQQFRDELNRCERLSDQQRADLLILLNSEPDQLTLCARLSKGFKLGRKFDAVNKFGGFVERMLAGAILCSFIGVPRTLILCFAVCAVVVAVLSVLNHRLKVLNDEIGERMVALEAQKTSE